MTYLFEEEQQTTSVRLKEPKTPKFTKKIISHILMGLWQSCQPATHCGPDHHNKQMEQHNEDEERSQGSVFRCKELSTST